MTRKHRIYPVLLAGALACAAHAQETPPAGKPDGAPPGTVRIKARTNPGDLQYLWVFDDQKLLQNDLPPEPRLVDFSWRITFVGMSEPEQDAWVPQGWAVALAGKDFARALPVARGGYFLLPARRWATAGS